MIGKLLGGTIGIIGALWLGIAGAAGMAWWDRAPDRPAWTQAHFLMLRFPHWLADPSLAMQRNQARADFLTERASFATVRRALDQQNAAVLSIQADADRWQAVGQDAERRVVQAGADRERLASRIMHQAPPTDTSAAGLCVAAEAVLRGVGQ